jgi:hypothetical protein
MWSLDSEDGKVTKLQTGQPWTGIPARSTSPKRPDWLWGPTSLLFSWYRGTVATTINWPGRNAGNWPPSSAEIRNERSYSSVPLFTFMVCSGTNVVRGGTTGWGTALQAEFARSNPDYVIGIFHWHNPSKRQWSWSRLSHWQKWVLGIFPGGKAGRK